MKKTLYKHTREFLEKNLPENFFLFKKSNKKQKKYFKSKVAFVKTNLWKLQKMSETLFQKKKASTEKLQHITAVLNSEKKKTQTGLNDKFLFSLNTVKSQFEKTQTRNSDFKNKLKENKKFSILYGNLSDKSIKKALRKAQILTGAVNDNLLCVLESRLDIILYRALFFSSIKAAKQWLTANKLKINSNFINTPSYSLQYGDIISIPKNNRKQVLNAMIKYFVYYNVINKTSFKKKEENRYGNNEISKIEKAKKFFKIKEKNKDRCFQHLVKNYFLNFRKLAQLFSLTLVSTNLKNFFFSRIQASRLLTSGSFVNTNLKNLKKTKKNSVFKNFFKQASVKEKKYETNIFSKYKVFDYFFRKTKPEKTCFFFPFKTEIKSKESSNFLPHLLKVKKKQEKQNIKLKQETQKNWLWMLFSTKSFKKTAVTRYKNFKYVYLFYYINDFISKKIAKTENAFKQKQRYDINSILRKNPSVNTNLKNPRVISNLKNHSVNTNLRNFSVNTSYPNFFLFWKQYKNQIILSNSFLFRKNIDVLAKNHLAYDIYKSLSLKAESNNRNFIRLNNDFLNAGKPVENIKNSLFPSFSTNTLNNVMNTLVYKYNFKEFFFNLETNTQNNSFYLKKKLQTLKYATINQSAYFTSKIKKSDLATRFSSSFKKKANRKSVSTSTFTLPVAEHKKRYADTQSSFFKKKAKGLQQNNKNKINMKPLNLEICYKTMTIIYLYPPQELVFPCSLDVELLVRHHIL